MEQPKLTRMQILTGIPAYVEMSGRAARYVRKSLPLILDLDKIIIDYYEGLYSDEIMNIWTRAHRDICCHNTWCLMIQHFGDEPHLCYKTKSKLEIFDEIISYLDISFDRGKCDSRYMDIIINYMISISHIWIYRDPMVEWGTLISLTMLNGIYILICACMQSKSDTFDYTNLPVWDNETSAFGPYKQLHWIKETRPNWNDGLISLYGNYYVGAFIYTT